MRIARIAPSLVAGAAALFIVSSAHAESAYDACDDAQPGQRSFCMIQARAQERANEAMAKKQDVTIHHDYNASNDTPAQTKAKQAYAAAANECYDEQPGQRGFCMTQAEQTYEKSMGW